MAKKLYINTKSILSDSTHIINNAASINYNDIIVKPRSIIQSFYGYVVISDTGSIVLNSNINNFYKTTSFIFSSGGQPRVIGTKETSSYYESKLSPDLQVNNLTII